jgi:hypothetical protein
VLAPRFGEKLGQPFAVLKGEIARWRQVIVDNQIHGPQ